MVVSRNAKYSQNDLILRTCVYLIHTTYLGSNFIHISRAQECKIHRYLIYTRWCIPHCGEAKIKARLQALVVPTELTRSMIICVFCIAEMDKVENKSSFIQLKVFNTQMQKRIVFSVAFFEWERPTWLPPIVMRGYR